MMPHAKMAPKAVRKPTAEKKVGAASRTTSTTRTKASLGDKKKEQVIKPQETENVAPEKVEEIVESLISSVISNVEAEFVENTQNLEIDPANRRRSSEPQQRSEDDSAAEERRRRIGRGDSEAQLEEILQHIFTAPTNVTIPTRKKSATITPAKNTAPGSVVEIAQANEGGEQSSISPESNQDRLEASESYEILDESCSQKS
ncbi:hypothetical protein OSTOST_23061 [Ostertagia ostertagi]